MPHVLNKARIMNMTQLRMQELCVVPNMSDHGSIRLNNARICLDMLNIPQYAYTLLNIAESP